MIIVKIDAKSSKTQIRNQLKEGGSAATFIAGTAISAAME
jgi:hypothetical protein